jgi:tripartite-type tricarboxylate transporter receptor subunit TctC
MNARLFLRGMLAAFPITLVAYAAAAAEPATFPQRSVRIVVPNDPGGTTDVLVRALVPSLSRTLGQPVVVENRAGGSATIGAGLVAKSEPDGYTLVAGSSATSSNQFILKGLSYDARTDLQPASRIAVTPYLLIVRGGLPAKSTPEFIALAKKSPGKLSYASSGVGTSPHLSAALFADATGVELLHVPYKGTAPALNDLIAGRVDAMFVGLPSAASHIAAGKLRALGVAADRRLPQLAGVPTMAEDGLKTFEANSWFGLLAPRGTPADVKRKLADAVRIAVQEKATAALFERLGAFPLHETPEAAQRFYEQDLKFWSAVVASFKGDLSQ